VAVAIGKLSLEEFMRLPDKPGVDLELFDGEVVAMPLPSEYHLHLQERIKELVHKQIGARYFVRVEFSYGAGADAHRVDVGAVPIEKWMRLREKRRDVPPPPPELIIEVRSPSNTSLEMNRLREVCFANGCLQFWEVDPDLRIITVFERERDPHVYRSGSSILLTVFGDLNGAVTVDEVFAYA